MTYPWRERFALLFTSNVVLSQLFRPSDWPIGPGSWLGSDLADMANRVFFPLLTACLALVLDVAWFYIRGRRESATAGFSFSHPCWIGSLGAILACLAVDFTFPNRSLSPDRVGIVPLEQKVCLAALVGLLLLPFANRWIWTPFRKSMQKQFVLTPKQDG